VSITKVFSNVFKDKIAQENSDVEELKVLMHRTNFDIITWTQDDKNTMKSNYSVLKVEAMSTYNKNI